MNLVDLLGEVHLLLLVDHSQARLAHQPPDDAQVSAHAAVHLIGHHALVRHVVLDHHQAVGPQGVSAPPQELHQVLVCQVAYGDKDWSSSQLFSLFFAMSLRGNAWEK